MAHDMPYKTNMKLTWGNLFFADRALAFYVNTLELVSVYLILLTFVNVSYSFSLSLSELVTNPV